MKIFKFLIFVSNEKIIKIEQIHFTSISLSLNFNCLTLINKS